jgi:hypothetical protein
MRCAIEANVGGQYDGGFQIGLRWFDHNNHRYLTVIRAKIAEDNANALVIETGTVSDPQRGELSDNVPTTEIQRVV